MKIDDTRPVLLVDMANTFTRHYVANPDMSSHGIQIGGVIGSLKIIRRIISDLSPKRVIIVWEGGGSSKRRAIYADYKANRKPERLNRFYEDDIPDTADNRVWQMATLAKLLKHFPVTQVYVQDCEGDDVIAYLCRTHFKQHKKIILSNDRDFYQLLDENTSVFSPQSKRIHTLEDVKKEFYGITPRNFALAKALCGDTSDNIKGVRGLGFKTLTSRIPLLVADDHDVTIDEVLDYCRVRMSEAKVMRETVQSKDTIRMNWRLVYLGGTTLINEQESKVDTILAEPIPKINMLSFMRDLNEIGVRSISSPHEFCTAFMPLTIVRKN